MDFSTACAPVPGCGRSGMIGLACRAFTSNLRQKGETLSGAALRAGKRGNGWWMAAVRYFTVLVRDAFLFGRFLDNQSGFKSSKIQWVKKQREGSWKNNRKEKKINSECSCVCTEAFPGVSGHQSNLMTVRERLGAEQIRQCMCPGSWSSFNSHTVSLPAWNLHFRAISSLVGGTLWADGLTPVVLSMG